jgi:hypothetical protein
LRNEARPPDAVAAGAGDPQALRSSPARWWSRALLPWLACGARCPTLNVRPPANSLVANVVAIVIAFWMRLSIETYPGIRELGILIAPALAGGAWHRAAFC